MQSPLGAYNPIINSFQGDPNKENLTERLETSLFLEKIGESLPFFIAEEAKSRQERLVNLENTAETTKLTSKKRDEIKAVKANPYTEAYTEAFFAFCYLPYTDSINTPYRITELAILRAQFNAKYPFLRSKIKEDVVLISGGGSVTPEIWAQHQFKANPSERPLMLEWMLDPEISKNIDKTVFLEFIYPNCIIGTDPHLYGYRSAVGTHEELAKIYNPSAIRIYETEVPEASQKGIHLGTNTHQINAQFIKNRIYPDIDSLNILRIDPQTIVPFEAGHLKVENANSFILELLKFTSLVKEDGVVNLTFGLGNDHNEFLTRMYLAKYLDDILDALKIKHVSIDLHKEFIDYKRGRNVEHIFAIMMGENSQIINPLSTAVSIYSLRFLGGKIDIRELKQLLYKRGDRMFEVAKAYTRKKIIDFESLR